MRSNDANLMENSHKWASRANEFVIHHPSHSLFVPPTAKSDFSNLKSEILFCDYCEPRMFVRLRIFKIIKILAFNFFLVGNCPKYERWVSKEED
jgi:hypothetical protein